jgi:hypothetical protein
MTALAAFRPRIAPFVGLCPSPVIDTAVLDACIDFCERSLAIRRNLDSFVTTIGVPEYDLAAVAPTDHKVVSVIRAWCDDVELAPLSDMGAGKPAASYEPARPYWFADADSDTGSIVLYQRPDAVYTVNVRAAVAPLRAATDVDAKLFEKHVEAIVNGALARIFAQPADWFDAAQAKARYGMFESAISESRLESVTGGVANAELRVRPVRI